MKTAGYKTVSPIDTDQHPARPGLEGPFRTKSGHVLYYDPKAGQYYDAGSDMYVSNEDYEIMNRDRDLI